MRRKRSNENVQRDILYNLFGVTIEQYEQVLKSQNGKCAMCGIVQIKDHELIVDYNYKENRIRGLLCEKCFDIIYQIGNDLELLEKAALYLKGQLCVKSKSSSEVADT